jgi:hypothetical protein
MKGDLVGRQGTLDSMLGFLGPLGPFGDAEKRDRRLEIWAKDFGLGVLDDLLDLAVHPPSASSLGRIMPDEFEYTLSRVLSLIGAQDSVAFLQRAAPLIRLSAARPTIIEVIGAIGAQEGLPWLIPLVEASGLSEDEETRLACAIGEIGGPQAGALLERLRARTPPGHRRTLEEIEIASESLRAEPGARDSS